MKRIKVDLTEEALQDIIDIYNYISRNDSLSIANKVYEKIKMKCFEIADFPHKGHVPPELERISIFRYLEINYKPYRIIYSITDSKVIIFCIFDGRRNIVELLTKRLIR